MDFGKFAVFVWYTLMIHPFSTCYFPSSPEPAYKYCIYGIKYYRNSSGFDSVFYFNDHNYPWSQHSYTHGEFEKAAKPLCDDLGNYARANAPYNALYYATWILTAKQTYEDIFMMCCKPCPAFKTEAQWRITLKLHFLIRRQYSLMKNYKFKEVANDTDGTRSYIDENYYITNRMPEANDHVETCNVDNLRRVPITSNNNVCFVTAIDKFDRFTLYDRQTEKVRNKTARDILRLGPYNAAKMHHMKDLRCEIHHTFDEDNECVVWMDYNEYGYECCCYGDHIGNCQERISNSIVVGIGSPTIYGEMMLCAIPKRNNGTVEYSLDTNSHKITIRGKMQNILSEMRTRSYCPLFLEISMGNPKHYFSAKDMQGGANKFGIHEGELAGDCHNFGNWDPRLQDIIQIRCFQLLPLTDMCPFNVTVENKDNEFAALCCCRDRSFCNYNGPVLNKLNEMKDYYCKYNSQYQFLFNDLYLIDKPTPRSCLLHYADSSVLMDMNPQLPKNNSILFQQPGNAFSPIDFSYALLKDGECRYIDVEVNYNYSNGRLCKEAPMFKTNYMPLKVFVCRCRTEPGAGKQCDEELAKNIASRASSMPIPKKTVCMYYNRLKFREINYRVMKRVYSTYTSYCYTEITLEMTESDVQFYASGDVATHSTVNKAGKFLDHIAYAMWLESGTRTSLCTLSAEGKKAYCFCRWYTERDDACNEYVWERVKTQRMLIEHEFLFQIRIEHSNPLADHLEKKGKAWCHFPGFYATLDIDMVNEDVITRGECVHRKAHAMKGIKDDTIFCVELAELQERCVAKVMDAGDFESNRLLCCCKDQCETVGFTIQTLAKNIEDRLDIY